MRTGSIGALFFTLIILVRSKSEKETMELGHGLLNPENTAMLSMENTEAFGEFAVEI